MLFGNDALFSIARSAKRGIVEMPPVLSRLRDWISAEYGVSVVYVSFDHIDIGPHAGSPRLTLILETDRDDHTWKTDVATTRPDARHSVLARFKEFAAADTETYRSLDRCFLTIDNFADECLVRACSAFLKNDVRRIVNALPKVPIWKIDGFSRQLVVFLETEADVRTITKSGERERLRTLCFDAVKRYDEFGYLSDESFRLAFDSKENLDRAFHGDLFSYWR